MSIEEYVPTEDELPADHWSKSPEWLDYKSKQAVLQASPAYKADAEKLKGFMNVGTVRTETRKMSTHDIQMASCKVEWVDPNPPAEETPTEGLVAMLKQADATVNEVFAGLTEEQLAEMARVIVERVSKVTDAGPAGS